MSDEPPQRTYPLSKPPGHKPPIPRWMLSFPPSTTHIYTLYLGLQSHAGPAPPALLSALQSWASASTSASDYLVVTEGFDTPGTHVWVLYFTAAAAYASALSSLDLVARWSALPAATRATTGLWTERFSTPVARYETNYSSLAHVPGAAQLPLVERAPHDITAYWGSARDRLPASAHDRFAPGAAARAPALSPRGVGQRVTGSSFDNLVHIRSGQWWEACSDAETAAYETRLEPTLMKGMRYLWSNWDATGTLGLRFLQNVRGAQGRARETCGAGFHRNLADLEKWAKSSPSHVAIFNGLMRHADEFGKERQLMTWHEVAVLKEGEGEVEYVNCRAGTGLMGHMGLEEEDLPL